MGAVMQDRVARYVEMIERPDTLETLSQRVAEEGSLADICRSLDVPHGRVLAWLMADPARYGVYQRALEIYAHEKVSEAIPIADAPPTPLLDEKGRVMLDAHDRPVMVQADTARDKLRVETRFRFAKHHAPAVYGEKIDVNHRGAPSFVVNIVGGVVERDVTPPRPVVDETVL